MVIVELKAKFLTVNNTKDRDIVEITGEGEYFPQKSKYTNREEDILVLPVLLNGNQSTFSLYEKYKKAFMDVWGEETKGWISKKFQVIHLNGKMEVSPIVSELVHQQGVR